ncbi:MAG: DNA polymerase I [Phototrophicales bacterium]|nr:MAG: DNA polymerase I [Phototrophicales bacterium]
MPAKRPLLVLVDGHAVAYRAYFALNAGSFSTSSGEPTNATYGFTRAILNILDESPDYFAISFDRGLSGREALYPEYKGTREKMPEDLEMQLVRIEALVRAFNIPVLALEGYEADDVIGTITQQAEAQGCDVRIVTGDRDILQLVSEHTTVQLPKRGADDVIYDLAAFRELYPALTPDRLPDLKGLMGDSSDNIPGVKGIGEKTGLKLLETYGTLENIYANIDEIKGAIRKKLVEGREMAFLSKQLATIMRDVPIQLDLPSCKTHDYDPLLVDEIFQELEFRSFRRRLRTLQADNSDTVRAEEPASLPEITIAPSLEVIVVNTPEQLTTMAAQLNQAKMISFDVETTGVRQMADAIVGISLAIDGQHGYYIPVGHVNPEGTTNSDGQASLWDAPPPAQLTLQQVLDAIRPSLTNPHIPKIGHNLKFDAIMLRRYGIVVEPLAYDTMIAEWLLVPDTIHSVGLKDVVAKRLGLQMTDIQSLIGSGKKQISFAEVDIEQAAPYAVADAALVFPLRQKQEAELAQHPALIELLHEMEMPLIPVIIEMEMRGVLLDTPYLESLSVELAERMHQLEQDIFLESGYGEFNLNSTQQLADVLFGKLNLSPKGIKRTKTGRYSLTADALETMTELHPIIPKILEYRHLQKLKSTYVDALPALINPTTGRVHTSYNQTGTSTGRFSSSDPNLQNIPIRTEEGRRIRRAFIAPKGYQLLSVDYSQIELRILAHFSGDEALIHAFEQGLDIHASTAAAVYRIPIEEVTYEQRSFAKAVNFGLMYGMGAFRLARDSELTYAEATDFIEAYFKQFPGVKRYLDNSKAFANQYGYVETLKGRRRNFPILQNPNTSNVHRQRAEREAINMPIQGTAADILKIAMINLHQALKTQGHDAHMILQVHDELVLEVAEGELDIVAPLVKQIMESAVTLAVPLRADAAVGPNWLEMKTYP